MRLDSRLFRLLLFCLALLPAFLTLWLILKYGVDVPFWDDWETAVLIEKFSKGTLTTADLFAKHNEYRQFFPNLLFVLLGWLTRWNLRYQMLVSFILACVVSFNIYRLAQLTSGSSKLRGLVQFVVANILIFSPMQYENWLMGIQVVYYVPIVCATTCLRIASSLLNERTKFITCACLAAVSTFSSINGILCWVVVLPVLVRSRSTEQGSGRNWTILAWVAGFAICVAFYLTGDEQIAVGSKFPDQPLVHLGQAVVYFTALLGAPLGIGRHPLLIAVPTGTILFLLFILCWIYFLKHSTDHVLGLRLTVWLMLGTFSVLTAAMVTGGRLHYRVSQALSSRYTTFSLYLMVSLVYLVPIILDQSTGFIGSQRRKPLMLLAKLAAILLVIGQAVAFPLVIQHGVRTTFDQRLQARACLALINFVSDDCGGTLYPDAAVLRQRANFLDQIGFLRSPLIKSDKVKEFESAETTNPEVFGSFHTIEGSDGNSRVAKGWLSLPGEQLPVAVFLAYENADSDFIVFASAEIEFKDRSIVDLFRRAERPRWHWHKEFRLNRLPTVPAKLRAWAIDVNTMRAYKLEGEKIVE